MVITKCRKLNLRNNDVSQLNFLEQIFFANIYFSLVQEWNKDSLSIIESRLKLTEPSCTDLVVDSTRFVN